VWISKQASSNQPPDLLNLQNLSILVGGGIHIPINAVDPDKDSRSISLNRNPDFASLEDLGQGDAVLHIKPYAGTDSTCNYLLRVVAVDSGYPALSDSETIRIQFLEHGLFLPFVSY
jgi:hypothetical protein